ncbi:hypothetical protein ACH5RR_037554 [Cinchona calisaya]|uniref:Uncharacterized protein n=1 Tax=Cinchona calisaya TaxID=153742 RepID=A0ABD2Y7W4_9GENT
MMKCDVVELEEQTIARYLGGLQSKISNIVQLQPYWTFDDVHKLAVRSNLRRKVPTRYWVEKESPTMEVPLLPNQYHSARLLQNQLKHKVATLAKLRTLPQNSVLSVKDWVTIARSFH